MKTIWTSMDGSRRSFDAMTDEHLANVIYHMLYYSERYNTFNIEKDSIVFEVMRVAFERGLRNDFISKAPYPYLNLKTKQWMIWSFKDCRDIPVVSPR